MGDSLVRAAYECTEYDCESFCTDRTGDCRNGHDRVDAGVDRLLSNLN